MARELRAGISYSADTAQTVLLDVQDQTVELQYIAEQTRDRFNEYWFLDHLLSLDKKILKKISKLSIALDNTSAFFHRFPLDSSLGKVDQNEQIEWELAQYKQHFKRQDYIHELHVLRTRASEQYLDVLVVAIPRSFIFGIQEALTAQELDLRLVDLNYFASQHLHQIIHPETKVMKQALVGIFPNGISIGNIQNNKLAGYINLVETVTEKMLKFLEVELSDLGVNNIFLHGTTTKQSLAMTEWAKKLRNVLNLNVTIINPFRRMRVSSSCKNFEQFKGYEHHFVACVGSALRD